MAEHNHDFWVLSRARKYDSGARGRSRFEVAYFFGWDSAIPGFVVKTESLGVARLEVLPMPTDLAEAFLLKCLEVDFNQLFLRDVYPSQPAEECIRAGAVELRLIRGKAQLASGGKDRLPSLSLQVRQEGKETRSLGLFNDLRVDLGSSMRLLMAEEIHGQLYISAAA